MHDPMVVAHQIPSLVPHRKSWRERTGRRWGFDVSRRTNPENRGERTYHWWRPSSYTLRLAGRAYGLGTLATIWHVEPGGHDAFDVCKHASRWKWHVHHWHVQIHALQMRRVRPQGPPRGLDFGAAYRLTRLLGYERDDDYSLVKKAPR